MQKGKPMELEVLSTPGHLISLAARGFERLSELRLKPFGFGVGYIPVLVAVKEGKAQSQRDLARFARVEQPSMAQMLARMERDKLVRRTPDPEDGRSSRISLTQIAHARLPEACAVLFQGNREVLSDFTDEEAAQLIALLTRLITNLDRVINADAPRNRKTKKASKSAPKTRLDSLQSG
jgi:MarR family transcriptional regulator, transcriptional regulator for hemolysin